MNYLTIITEKDQQNLQNSVNKFLEQNQKDAFVDIKYLIDTNGFFNALIIMTQIVDQVF
jgi:C4-dicarboxylate-specific signal transduction histidine kinase